MSPDFPEEKLGSLAGKKILFMGIGHPLRGDDGAGLELAGRLKAKGGGMIIEAGSCPENFLGPAISCRPEVILIADAARLRLPPGSSVLLDREELSSGTVSTHDAPLSALMELLQKATGARVLLLGIQSKDTRWGMGLSPEVESSLSRLVSLLAGILDGQKQAPAEKLI